MLGQLLLAGNTYIRESAIYHAQQGESIADDSDYEACAQCTVLHVTPSLLESSFCIWSPALQCVQVRTSVHLFTAALCRSLNKLSDAQLSVPTLQVPTTTHHS